MSVDNRFLEKMLYFLNQVKKARQRTNYVNKFWEEAEIKEYNSVFTSLCPNFCEMVIQKSVFVNNERVLPLYGGQLTVDQLCGMIPDDEEQIDELQMKVEPEKCEIPLENVRDPYAEQRKWIGKLCWFSDGDSFDEVGYLTEIDPDMPEAKFRCNCHDYYEVCKPVKPDDDIIYKGGDNE